MSKKLTLVEFRQTILEDPRSKNLDFTPDGRLHYAYRVSKDGDHYYGSKSELLGVVEATLGDGYYTSSNYLEESFKANPEDYKVKIIKNFNNSADKMIYESYLHQYFDVKLHDSFINRSNQTPFGFDRTGVGLGDKSPYAREVYKINPEDGEIVYKYGSLKTAGESIEKGNINIAIRNISKTAGGFVWCYCEDYNNEIKKAIVKINYNHGNPIYRINTITGEIIEEYSSMYKAQKLIKKGSICHVIIGLAYTADGDTWCYKKDYNIEKKQEIINFNFNPTGKKAIYLLDDITGEVLKEFSYVKEAQKIITGGDIAECCIFNGSENNNGVRKAGGKIFIYKEDFTLEFSNKIKIKDN